MKDIWDKISSIVTVIIAVATVIIGVYTNKISNELDAFKNGIDEEKMVSELVNSIASNDTVSSLKSDLIFLTLERYFRKSNRSGELNEMDKKMLLSFAQSLILARKQQKTTSSFGLEVPYDFLKKTDIKLYDQLNLMILSDKSQTNLPPVVVSNENMIAQLPIKTVVDESSKEIYSSILNKIVYLQYADSAQLNTVKTIRKQLKGNSWIVPGIELVRGNYSNTIKYFHEEDQKLALDLTTQLNSMSRLRFTPIRIFNFEKRVPNGQLEIWVNSK